MIQFCTFVVAEHLFGIEVLRVQEVLSEQPLTPVPLAAAEIRGLMNLRGQIVAALDLRRRLGFPDRKPGEPTVNVIVRTEDSMVSLLADAIEDVLDMPEDLFETPPETLRDSARELVTGAFKLPDRLLLVLELDRILDAKGAELSR